MQVRGIVLKTEWKEFKRKDGTDGAELRIQLHDETCELIHLTVSKVNGQGRPEVYGTLEGAVKAVRSSAFKNADGSARAFTVFALESFTCTPRGK